MKKLILTFILLASPAFADSTPHQPIRSVDPKAGYIGMTPVVDVEVEPLSLGNGEEFVRTVAWSTDLVNWIPAGAGTVYFQGGYMPPGGNNHWYITKQPGPKMFFRVQTFIPKGFYFTRNLYPGDRGDDVAYLQTFLEELGFADYPWNAPKGYYDEYTRQAMVRYQQHQFIYPQNGYFEYYDRYMMNFQLGAAGH